jgi:hypothetical protein
MRAMFAEAVPIRTMHERLLHEFRANFCEYSFSNIPRQRAYRPAIGNGADLRHRWSRQMR